MQKELCSKYRAAVNLVGLGVREGGRKGEHGVSSGQTLGAFVKDNIRNLDHTLNGMESL